MSDFTALRIVHKSRKEYGCMDCGHYIPQGTKHLKVFGMLEHNRLQGRLCASCCERAQGSDVHAFWTRAAGAAMLSNIAQEWA